MVAPPPVAPWLAALSSGSTARPIH